MGQNRLDEILASINKELYHKRSAEGMKRLFSLLKIFPQFNDLENLWYVDSTGVMCKMKGEKEKVLVNELAGDNAYELVKAVILKLDEGKK